MADQNCPTTDVVGGTIYCCTLPVGHVPTTDHRSDYVTLDPATSAVVTGSHAWTAPA